MEIWKDIKGFEGLYKVSNLGNVKSLDRELIRILKQGPTLIRKNGRVLKCRKIGNKNRNSIYNQVAIYDINRNRCVKMVHRLVAEAFIGDIPESYVVNHKDFNGLNNNVNNLEITTQKDNVIHYFLNR